MIMGQMDDYVSSLAKMNVLNKSNTKSANLLNIQYKIMSKIFGPFLDLYVDLKSHVQTAVEVTESFTKATEETGEAVEEATGGLTALLATFRQINIIMTFILIMFAAVAAALYMVSTTVGGAAADFSIFNDVVAAAQGVFTELIGVWTILSAAFGSVDFAGTGAIITALLQGFMDLMGSILVIYLSLVGAVIGGIGQIIQKMSEAGMLQRIADALGGFIGSIALAFAIVFDALKETGLTVDGVIQGINDVVNYFVNWLFSSGLIDFFVTWIEYVAKVYGFIAIMIGFVISGYIRIWAILGPPLVRFVKAVFDFLNPIIRIITGILGLIMSAVMELIDWLMPYMAVAFEGIMSVMEPVAEFIGTILDGISSILSFGGGLLGGAADMMGFASGGIASGPSSGYPVELHGTEAVVPLPDGRTIPVSIKGDVGGGGTTNTINISVSGGGNAKEIAKQVSDEVSKVLRTRSRGNNYTRGVI